MTRYILCSPYLPDEIRGKIEKISGDKCISVPICESLPKPVSHHPDMLFFNPPNEAVTVLSRAYHAVNPQFFDDFTSSRLCLCGAELGVEYPSDIAYDAIAVGANLYCLESYTSAVVKRYFSRVVNIKQGYAACSTLILNGQTAITADKGIANALEKDGVDVLRISPGGIELPGYGCGFIGGASAVINNKVVFFGSLKDHPDGERIMEICRVNGMNTVDFPNLPLTDYGSIRYLFVNDQITR